MSVVPVSAVKLAGKTVFSGVQPSGVFHLGNLLGATRVWAQIADSAPKDASVIFMVADLHALTVPKPPNELRERRWQALASIMASGVDPEKSCLYFQSQVSTHSELHWLLSCHTSMGYLGRMTQWKTKAHIGEDVRDMGQLFSLGRTIEQQNLGLFTYPTLQAADILIHQTDYVPVGEDQAQHLELCRQLATSLNFHYGEFLRIPKTVLAEQKRILSLRNPTAKMSKSDANQAASIYVTDTPDEISSKLRRAVTDSVQGPITYEPETRPGVANLLEIGASFSGCSPEEFLVHGPKNHKELKDLVSQSVIEGLRPVREAYNRYMDDPGFLEAIARKGSVFARTRTEPILREIKQRMGLD